MILLGGAAVAAPLAGRAQQPAGVASIGILSDDPQWTLTPFESTPFAQGLRDLGYAEGQNLVIERRYARTNRYEILRSLAADLVRLQPSVILADHTGAALAAKEATQTIPIVFVESSDPVGSGLVPSLARPAGNITGLSTQSIDISAKRLELLTIAYRKPSASVSSGSSVIRPPLSNFNSRGTRREPGPCTWSSQSTA
jgi:putative ABC transport system substrate-binding protein